MKNGVTFWDVLKIIIRVILWRSDSEDKQRERENFEYLANPLPLILLLLLYRVTPKK